MLWSKLKNMILAVLLLTNLFLLALVLSETVAGDEQEQEARETALAFLRQRGLTVSEEMVPKTFQLQGKEMTWDMSSEEDLVTSFLGTVEVESLGGDMIRYYNEHGELQFHGNGEFYGQFLAPTFPIGEETMEEHGTKQLELLGIQAVLLDMEEEHGRSSLRFVQVLDGVLLLDCEIVLVYENEILWEISRGKRLKGTFVPSGGETITVATALMQCYIGMTALGHSATEISLIQESYLVTMPVSSPVILTPAWRIVTESHEYFLNGVTGALEVKSGLFPPLTEG